MKITGVPAKKLPTAEESREIKEEVDSLPPVDSLAWMYPGMTARNWEALSQQHWKAAVATAMGYQTRFAPLPLQEEAVKLSEETTDEQKGSQ